MQKQNQKTKTTKDLSIVILNYNTKKVLSDCLNSIKKVRKELDFETIVIDNGSSDGSVKLLESKFKWVRLIKNSKNLGFAKGNNQARGKTKGKYILFLNSDTLMHRNTLKKSFNYAQQNNIKAITVKQVLPSGKLDKDSRRSFPTPWVALTHFSGLDRIFPNSRLFSQYWYGYLPENKIHSIDVSQGAFFMIDSKLLEKVGWFNEAYFLDGEDIDLSWKIIEQGEKIIYYPLAKITHVKKVTKNKYKSLRRDKSIEAMEKFYKERLWSRYPLVLNYLVILGIRALRLERKYLGLV